MAWQFRVLGRASFSDGAVSWQPERKTAGALCYVALNGPTPRSKLAGLLWPDSGEEAARNNLAQVLQRVKKRAGVALLAGRDSLSLNPALEVDAARFKILMATGAFTESLALRGELLSGYDFDDCPDFADWLYAERETLLQERCRALFSLASDCEGRGEYRAALLHVDGLLGLVPVSEESWRSCMRLHYLGGDRAGALDAYHHCQNVLKRELGVEPLPETKALARHIEAGDALVGPTPHKHIPLSLLRPPRLIGRESECAQLEAAWVAGVGIALCGDPGVGKSRLMNDFLTGKGRFELLDGRPGDAGVPYASYRRSVARTLAGHPRLELPTWVQKELSRLLPELGKDSTPPATENKLHFFEALAWLLGVLTEEGLVAVAIDDLQFVDRPSFEAAQYVASRLSGEVHTVACYRKGELAPELQASIEGAARHGQAALIEVGPLAPEALALLLETLELPETPDAERLTRFTGGNPLFVLETLKSLHETGAAASSTLPVSGKLKTLIADRLARLSPGALNLARCAAVLGGEVSLEPAAHLLGQTPLNLSGPLDELEAAHILQDGRFSHDLLRETVLETTPAPVRSYLEGKRSGAPEERKDSPSTLSDLQVN